MSPPAFFLEVVTMLYYRTVCLDNDKAAALLWMIGRRYTDFSLYCEPGQRPEYELMLQLAEARKGWRIVEDQKYMSPQARRADLLYLSSYWLAYMQAINVRAVGLCRGFRENGPGQVWSDSWNSPNQWDADGAYLSLENPENRLSVFYDRKDKLVVSFLQKDLSKPTDKFEMLVEYLETHGYANADPKLPCTG